MAPPVNGTDPPPRRRLSAEERAERNRAIARAHLAGQSWREICEEHGVSRNTARQAARDYADALRREEEPEELTAIRDVDVEALISLGIEAHGAALTRMLKLLRGPDGTLVVGAANAVSRLLSSITQNLVRLGVIADPTDEALRRRIEEAERVWGRVVAQMAARAGLTDAEFEEALRKASEDSFYAGGLVLAGTNGRSSDGSS